MGEDGEGPGHLVAGEDSMRGLRCLMGWHDWVVPGGFPSAIDLRGTCFPEDEAAVIGPVASFGNDDVIDPGLLETARGTAMPLPIRLRLLGALGTGVFKVKVGR